MFTLAPSCWPVVGVEGVVCVDWVDWAGGVPGLVVPEAGAEVVGLRPGAVVVPTAAGFVVPPAAGFVVPPAGAAVGLSPANGDVLPATA
jgi:hypothetical protein